MGSSDWVIRGYFLLLAGKVGKAVGEISEEIKQGGKNLCRMTRSFK